MLADIFSNTERPDKITVTLDYSSHSIKVEYDDLDEEWSKELRDAAKEPE